MTYAFHLASDQTGRNIQNVRLEYSNNNTVFVIHTPQCRGNEGSCCYDPLTHFSMCYTYTRLVWAPIDVT